MVNVGVHKTDHDISVGMAIREVVQFNILVVQVKIHAISEGDLGPRSLVARGDRLVVLGIDGLLAHPLTYNIVRYESDAHLFEILITPGMVAVNVRVQQETDLTAIDAVNCSLDLLRQRSKLIVDHEESVGSGEQPDISTRALQHIN